MKLENTRNKDLVAYKKGSETIITHLTDDLKCVYTGKSYADRKDLVTTYREAANEISKLEDKKYNTPWQKISEEIFWERLEILPPQKWETTNGVEMFYISESMSGTYHEHVAKYKGKCYSAIRDIRKDRSNLVMELQMQLEAEK